MKENIKRTMKLTDDQAAKIGADLNGDAAAKLLAKTLNEFLSIRIETERKAWDEVHRIASIDELTETCSISWATNEIIIRERSGGEND